MILWNYVDKGIVALVEHYVLSFASYLLKRLSTPTTTQGTDLETNRPTERADIDRRINALCTTVGQLKSSVQDMQGDVKALLGKSRQLDLVFAAARLLTQSDG